MGLRLRLVLFAITGLPGFPAEVSAQARERPPVIAPGDTVRLTTLDGPVAIGTLYSRFPDTLYVRGDRGTQAVAIHTLRHVEVRRGSTPGDGRLFGHVVLGGVLGAAAWFALGHVVECSTYYCEGGGSIIAFYGMPVGFLAGAVIGGVRAHRQRVPRWIPAALEP